jgi:hypothetical protein
MADYEEDTYSTIFYAMKHPMRRKIILTVGSHPSTYTEVLTSLGIETGHLNYHLEALSGLLIKRDDGKYTLSEYGLAAKGMLSRTELPSPRKGAIIFRNKHIWLSSILLVLIMVSGVSVYVTHVNQIREAELVRSTALDARSLFYSSGDIIGGILASGKVSGAPLNKLYTDSVKLSACYGFLARIDAQNEARWMRVRGVAEALTDFAYLLDNKLTSYMILQMDVSNNSLRVTQKMYLEKLASDFEKLSIIMNSSHSGISQASPLELDQSVKDVLSDIYLVKSSFNLPESYG